MSDLSIFIDESGTQEGLTRYYLVTLVLHEQAVDIAENIAIYESSLLLRGLPDIPFHANPLLRAHGAYVSLSPECRKRLLVSFGAFVRKLPVRYKTLMYRSKELCGADHLQALIRRDLADFVFDHLQLFQSFEAVKIYYDGGQDVVTRAVHAAFEYALARDAALYRETEYTAFRLSQVADYLCAVELAAIKYSCGEISPSEERFFGGVGNFKKNWLKPVKKLRM